MNRAVNNSACQRGGGRRGGKYLKKQAEFLCIDHADVENRCGSNADMSFSAYIRVRARACPWACVGVCACSLACKSQDCVWKLPQQRHCKLGFCRPRVQVYHCISTAVLGEQRCCNLPCPFGDLQHERHLVCCCQPRLTSGVVATSSRGGVCTDVSIASMYGKYAVFSVAHQVCSAASTGADCRCWWMLQVPVDVAGAGGCCRCRWMVQVQVDGAGAGGCCRCRWMLQVLVDVAGAGGCCRCRWMLQVQVDGAGAGGCCRCRWMLQVAGHWQAFERRLLAHAFHRQCLQLQSPAAPSLQQPLWGARDTTPTSPRSQHPPRTWQRRLRSGLVGAHRSIGVECAHRSIDIGRKSASQLCSIVAERES